MAKFLSGTITALVTPFKGDGSLDEDAFEKLIEFQIENGVQGIVPCGTTGESPTVSHEENDRLVDLAVKFTAGRCKVIAGTGSNATSEAIMMTEHAKKVGADASLQVAPYYNKPTQAGLYAHYRAIAEAVDLPMIIYNIPGRTAVDVANETTAKLRKDLPRQVVGLKDATGSAERVRELVPMVDEDFTILSGDDALTIPMMKVGASGVISVASNVKPQEVCAMTAAALSGDFAHAEELNAELLPLFKALFIETNPIPVKSALAMMGKIEEVFRLPLVGLSPENRETLVRVLKEQKLI